jgi:hypothetical protein
MALLIIVPVAPFMHLVADVPSIWVFVASILGLAVMADWIRAATGFGESGL